MNEITKIGQSLIWFEYKGDEIAWDGCKWLSLSCCACFETLEAMDDFWEAYYNGCLSVSNTHHGI